jgi:2-dehydro-3-deoxygluconokinase
MQPEIVSMGEPMLEFNATDEGPLSRAGRFSVGWGGDTSNFAIGAARLGGKVGYITRLGDDEFGESFVQLWKREGVDISRVVRDPEAPTGIYFISREGDRHFFTYYRKGSAASRMSPDSVPRDYIAGAKVFHVSGITQGISSSACDAAFAAMGAARESGVTVSYDPNLRLKLWPLDRARAVIHRSIAMADMVFPSLDDARVLTGKENPEEIARYYLHMGPRIVVVKLGPEGALLATGDGLERFPPYQVNAMDASGAGDAFDAGFAVGYLSGWPLDRCVRFANAAGALTTTGLGVVSSIPIRETVVELMASSG